ncbi:RING-H2 finger protein ATL47-like [Impatiens glandulifera]|uniref:RING-H2 finger protein ATL47-like n=1 Tax=Impatiens glandulifera TaxID=253017 RepID=UPI001FB154DD|nr:RING-H2 finger protein ATL47-like [Impatiens glandulifera]
MKSNGFGSNSPFLSPLFIIVILAVIFFIAGLLHLLARFLIKQRSSSPVSRSEPNPDSVQRQLQQLFHLHDSGLDQEYIDALPVFLHKEIMGLKESFDCAVCLCEFSEHDKLRLLPLCSHAFHVDCIDTWLLSNSTCPLCRGTLFAADFSIQNPCFDFDDSTEEGDFSNPKPVEAEIVREKRVFSVRLGKFKNTNVGEGETSSSSRSVDARRCYSMGSFQYVVQNSELQVILKPNITAGGIEKSVNLAIDGGGETEGKNINSRSKGDSFSVSKIWLWSKKNKFVSSSSDNPVNLSLPR